MFSRTLLCVLALAGVAAAADADLIFHNGRIVTVDTGFRVVQAMAVKNGRITALGSDAQVLKAERTPRTHVQDLGGKTVLPGMTDAHVHPAEAGLSEYFDPLPRLDSIQAIQHYIRSQAQVVPKGEWIVVPRTLPPRLEEMRFPTKHDLDVVTDHPVAFDGSYVWGANSMALRISGITRDTPNPPGGEIVKGPDGEPNGILRAASQLLKGVRRSRPATEEQRLAALEKMLELYAAAGLTAVGDRAVRPPEVALYEKLKAQGRLPIRAVLTWRPGSDEAVDVVVKRIQDSKWTTNQGDEWLKFGSYKVTLDGGQSVGTAYQRVPYGPFGKQLYGQTNPEARGTLFVEADKLYRIFAAARDKGWQLTAHVQGGGAIDALLDAFERLNKDKPIRPSRSHVMHGSFMSEAALDRMQRLGVAVDAQPGWLYYDVPALGKVFGVDKMRWFFPLKSFFDRGIPVAGGSDHMIGWNKSAAVNSFNPFLNMWICMTRRTVRGDVIYPEESITREQALKMWTTGPAWLQFAEKERGSLERGKLADFVIIDRDFLKCPVNEIKDIEPLETWVEGKQVYRR
jgi:predicted amidohydrolase YtcJ